MKKNLAKILIFFTILLGVIYTGNEVINFTFRFNCLTKQVDELHWFLRLSSVRDEPIFQRTKELLSKSSMERARVCRIMYEKGADK